MSGFRSVTGVVTGAPGYRRLVTDVVLHVSGFGSVAGVVTRAYGFGKPVTDVMAHVWASVVLHAFCHVRQ